MPGAIGTTSAGCWIEARVLAKPIMNPNRYYILMLPQSQQGTDDPGLRHVYEYDVASGEETVLFAATTSEVANGANGSQGRNGCHGAVPRRI